MEQVSSNFLSFSLICLLTLWWWCDRLANSSSTCLCTSTSLLSPVTVFASCWFLLSSFSVCLDWYSSSVVSLWFSSTVSLVVVCSYSSLIIISLFLVCLILLSMSFLSFSVVCIFSRSSSCTACSYLSLSSLHCLSRSLILYCIYWRIETKCASYW